jgi:hypothetical protein
MKRQRWSLRDYGLGSHEDPGRCCFLQDINSAGSGSPDAYGTAVAFDVICRASTLQQPEAALRNLLKEGNAKGIKGNAKGNAKGGKCKGIRLA